MYCNRDLHKAIRDDYIDCPFCSERIGDYEPNNRHRMIEKSVQFVEDHTLFLYYASIWVMLAFSILYFHRGSRAFFPHTDFITWCE